MIPKERTPTPKKEVTSIQKKEDLFMTLSDTDVPPSEEPFSLEEILAEYSGSQDQQLLRETAELIGPNPPEPEPPPEPKKPPSKEAPAAKPEPEPSPVEAEPPPPSAEPEPPQPSGPSTPASAPDPLPPVQTPEPAPAMTAEPAELPFAQPPIPLEEVMSSTVEAVLEEREPLLPPRRGLFSRKPLVDSEELPLPPEPEPEYDPEPIGPELNFREATLEHKREIGRAHV